jgi:hypothetical protein
MVTGYGFGLPGFAPVEWGNFAGEQSKQGPGLEEMMSRMLDD